jgi:hypothetical protein
MVRNGMPSPPLAPSSWCMCHLWTLLGLLLPVIRHFYFFAHSSFPLFYFIPYHVPIACHSMFVVVLALQLLLLYSASHIQGNRLFIVSPSFFADSHLKALTRVIRAITAACRIYELHISCSMV